MGFLGRLKKRLAVAPARERAKQDGDWKEVLQRHFELTDVLGRGGYSTVYRGRRRADSRTYAIKVTDLEALTPWSRAAAVREAQVLAALTGRGPGGFRHPCIATFREAFCLQSRLCIVTDPAPGGDLKRLLEQRAAAGGRLAEREVWSIFLQVALALQHLHAHRVLHRDLKPHNCLLSSGGVVQLTDFGICGQLSRVFTRKEAGTPQYKAPEMWAGQPYSFSSDMWALGCLLYEMCAARPMFDAPPGASPEAAVESVRRQVLALSAPPPLPPGYSGDLAALLAVLLRQAPADRPSADELLALPAVAARMHELPAAVREGLADAAAAQHRWQQQQVASEAVVMGSGAVEPVNFTPPAVNACLPPAAYSAACNAGLLGNPPAGKQQQQPGQLWVATRGRGGSRHGANAQRERSASSGSVRSAASSAAGSSSSDGIRPLDLAVPLDCPITPRSGRAYSVSSGKSLAVSTPVLNRRCLAPADSSRSFPLLARQSCPDFLATLASSSTVHI